MLRFMVFGLAAAILAAMLNWGTGSSQRATDISTKLVETDAPSDKDRPKTAAEVAAIIEEIKAGPERAAFRPRVDAAKPELAVDLTELPAEKLVLVAAAEPEVPEIPEPSVTPDTVLTTGLPEMETGLPEMEIAEPEPPAASEPPVMTEAEIRAIEEMEAEFVAARFEAPEAAPPANHAVSRSRLPTPRPASPPPATVTTAALSSTSLPEDTAQFTPPEAEPAPEPEIATVQPNAVSLAIAEAMESAEPEDAQEERTQPNTGLVFVSGSRVNLRSEPSTDAEVVTWLHSGDAAHILSETGDGWVRIRDLSSGDEGYMAEIFLSATAPG